MRSQPYASRTNDRNPTKQIPYNRSHAPRTSFTPKKQRFTKIQCHACQKFGHVVTHCTLLPLVLAILRFHSKNKEQCETVLKKHIEQNSVSSKKTFVRALQHAEVLSDGDDSDHHMEADIVVHSIIDNDIHIDDLQDME